MVVEPTTLLSTFICILTYIHNITFLYIKYYESQNLEINEPVDFQFKINLSL